MKKKLLLVFAIAAGLMLAAVLILYLTVDVDSFRGFIEGRAEAVLDRDVELGELHLSILPRPGLRVDDVSVRALPEEGDGDVLRIRSLRIGARLLPLIRKRLEVTSLVLVEPSVNLARNAKGEWNLKHGGGTKDQAPDVATPDAANAPAPLKIDTLRVTGGRLTLRDAFRSPAQPREIAVTDLEAELEGIGTGTILIAVDGGKMRLVDPALGEEPIELVVDDLELAVNEGSDGAPMELRLEVRLGGDADGARLAARGQLGRTDGPATAMRVEIEDLPLAALHRMLPEATRHAAVTGSAGLALDVAGRLPEDFTATGDLSVTGATTVLTGDRKIDARLDLDLAVSDGGDLLELRTFDVVLGGSTIGLTGTVLTVAEGRRLDLELQPVRLAAAELSSLAALVAPDLGLSMAGEQPVEIEGGLRGPLTESRLPEIRGRMKLSGLTVEMATLGTPVTDVTAEVTLRGRTVELTGLQARSGDNDLTGSMQIELGDAPTLGFDLQSQRADLDQLLGLMSGDTGEEAGTTTPPAEDSFLMRGITEGRLRVAEGSWATLRFQQLDARLRVAEGVATLDPVSMSLYDGRFRGRLASDLTKSPPSFELSGNVKEADVGPFLADQMDAGDMLSGRLSGRIKGGGSGSDAESVMQNLDVDGAIRINEGSIGKLDVLGSIGQVAGVLGQRTIANLATTTATDATKFSEMVGKFRIEEGRLLFNNMLLKSEAFDLAGDGGLDLASSMLEGAFEIRFSPQVSAWMRQESSRAAELFWDSRSGRVVLPLGLKGPIDSAGASVDWSSAARGLVERAVENELEDLLGDVLGGSREDPPAAGADAAPTTAAAPPSRDTSGEAAPRRGESPSGKIKIEVTDTRWGGSVLTQDYKIEGRIRGPGIQRFTIQAIDASGKQIDSRNVTVDRSPPVKGWRTFTTRVDGKSLVLAGLPMTVTLSAVGADGDAAEVTLEVTR